MSIFHEEHATDPDGPADSPKLCPVCKREDALMDITREELIQFFGGYTFDELQEAAK
jgi:hypothetical protein